MGDLNTVVEDIKSWAKDKSGPCLAHKKKKKIVAHWFASYCLNRRSVSGSGCIPPSGEILLAKDVNPGIC